MGNQIIRNFSESVLPTATQSTLPIPSNPIPTKIDYLSLQEKWNSIAIFIRDIISAPANISKLPRSYTFKILPILACDMILLPSQTTSNHLLLIVINQACCILIYDILIKYPENKHSTKKPVTNSILSINIIQSLQLSNNTAPKLISINADGKYFIIREDKKTLAVFHKNENTKTFLKKYILDYTQFFIKSISTYSLMISHSKFICKNILIFTEKHQLFIIDYAFDRMLGVFDFGEYSDRSKILNIDSCITNDGRIIIGAQIDSRLALYRHGILYVCILDITQLIKDYGDTKLVIKSHLKVEDYCIQNLKNTKNMKFSPNGDYLCCGSVHESSSTVLIYKKIVSKKVMSIFSNPMKRDSNDKKFGNAFQKMRFFGASKNISENDFKNDSNKIDDFLNSMVVGKKPYQYILYRQIRFDSISKTIGYYFEHKFTWLDWNIFAIADPAIVSQFISMIEILFISIEEFGELLSDVFSILGISDCGSIVFNLAQIILEYSENNNINRYDMNFNCQGCVTQLIGNGKANEGHGMLAIVEKFNSKIHLVLPFRALE